MTVLLASALLGISGSYFESRTCALYAGPCHYSGEVMVDGSTALLAWEFGSGTYEGMALAGISVAAVVRAEKNFEFDSPRKSIIVLPANVSERERTVLLSLIRQEVNLGSVVSNVIGTVTRGDNSIIVMSGSELVFSALTSSRECRVCSMPGQLWYEPLTRGTDTRVATVDEQILANGSLGETWKRKDEPAAFVGSFSW